MPKTIIDHIKEIRTFLVRRTKPGESYWLARRSVKPLSGKFGFDRGTPIDRFWIEKFLWENKSLIKGMVLEVTDNNYTKMFGGNKVKRSDVLDINRKNKRANIHGDLKNLRNVIKDNTYDCIILTHVLGMIDDVSVAVSEIHRILKQKGVVLVTSSSFSPTYDQKNNFWRFTTASMKYLFGKQFGIKNIKITSFGNVLTGQAFWVGMAQEELTEKELSYNDPNYQCIVTVKAVKK